jgi:hypothetical protein
VVGLAGSVANNGVTGPEGELLKNFEAIADREKGKSNW